MVNFLIVLLLLPAVSAAVCAETADTNVEGVGLILTCLKFHSSGPVLNLTGETSADLGVLYLREGDTEFFAMGATDTGGVRFTSQEWTDFNTAYPDAAAHDFQQIIVKATGSPGTRTFALFLYIPLQTMVQPFKDYTFKGVINNKGPLPEFQLPTGVPVSSDVYIKYGDEYNEGELLGDFLNRYTRVDISTTDSEGVTTGIKCLDALNFTTGAMQWYDQHISTDKMGLKWYPGMHAIGDSRMCLQLIGSINFMAAPWFRMYELHNTSVTDMTDQDLKFMVHATPFNTTHDWSGRFSNTDYGRVENRDTPYSQCPTTAPTTAPTAPTPPTTPTASPTAAPTAAPTAIPVTSSARTLLSISSLWFVGSVMCVYVVL